MEFISYATNLVVLVNAELDGLANLRAHLADRPWLAERATGDDIEAIAHLRARLHPVFDGDEQAAVDTINTLLEDFPAVPYVSGHGGDEPFHLHVSDRGASVTDTVAAEGLLGLAVLACDLGPDRFGTCADERCRRYFVDTSTNRSRRYCSARCANRANVAAWRARQATD